MAPSAPSKSLEATHDTHGTLDAALAVFDGPDCTTAPSGGRQQLRDLAEKHKQAAAKAVLLVSGAGGSGASGGTAPAASASVTAEELRGVLSSVEQSTIALCSHCHGFTAGAGPSLKQSLKQLCGAVVGPTKELVDKLAACDAEGLRRAFGLVWGACDELTRGPLDNKASLFRQLADVMGGIKGAAKELDELCEASRQELGSRAGSGAIAASESADSTAQVSPSNGNGNCNGNGNGNGAAATATATAGEGPGGGAELRREGAGAGASDRFGEGEQGSEGGEGQQDDEDEDEDEDEDGFSDDFRDMGTLSETELRTAEAAAALLGAAQAVMRLISRPLLEGPPLGANSGSPSPSPSPSPGPPSDLDEWESLTWHAARLRSSCEALVACLYPPHDELEELVGESEAVSNTLELMLEELPESAFGGPPEGEGEGEGPERGAAAQQLRQSVRAVRAEVEAVAGRLADELSRRGRPAGGA